MKKQENRRLWGFAMLSFIALIVITIFWFVDISDDKSQIYEEILSKYE